MRYPWACRVGWPLAVLGAGACGTAATRAGVLRGHPESVALFPFAALLVGWAPVLAWRLGAFAVRVDAAGVHRRRGRRWATAPWAGVGAVEVGARLADAAGGARLGGEISGVRRMSGDWRRARTVQLLDARGRTLLALDPLDTWPLAAADAARLAAALAEGMARGRAAAAARVEAEGAAPDALGGRGATCPAHAACARAPRGRPLSFAAAGWQRTMMTALPLLIGGAFGATFAAGMRGPGRWAAGAACLALSAGLAAAGVRGLGRVRLTLDADATTFHDGTRERRAAWADVACCGVEARERAGRPDTVAFRDASGRELLGVPIRLWEPADARRWMAYAEARLAERGTRIYGPAGAWPGADARRGTPRESRRTAVTPEHRTSHLGRSRGA